MPQGPADGCGTECCHRLPSARLLSACCQLVVNLSAGHRPAIAVRHSLFFAARSPGHRRPLSVACPSPAVCPRPMTVRRNDAGRLRGGVPGPSAVRRQPSAARCQLSVVSRCWPSTICRPPPGYKKMHRRTNRSVHFLFESSLCYSDTIASEGHTPAQVPQSMHLSGSIT